MTFNDKEGVEKALQNNNKNLGPRYVLSFINFKRSALFDCFDKYTNMYLYRFKFLNI